MKKIIVTLFVIIASLPQAYAGTALELQKLCKSDEKSIQGVSFLSYCLGYLGGIHELHTIYSDKKLNLGTQIYCPPDTFFLGEQLRKIFLDWTKQHPEDLKQRDSLVFIAAMKKRFPCK